MKTKRKSASQSAFLNLRVLKRTVIAALFVSTLFIYINTASAGIPGAIYTTIRDGTVVNQNIYGMKEDVYLSGGPQNQNARGLPDGTYYFQITDPSGHTLLSTDPAVCRQLLVSGGRVAGSTGPTCKHMNGTFNVANGTLPVQMAPFLDTPNNGNEYKAWLVPVGSATIGTDGKTLNFSNSAAKTDNFKVQTTAIPPAIASCLPTSSLGVLVQGSTVTAYVPNGSWIGSNTGIQVVPMEPPGPATSIATTSVVNSCSSNSSTGQTVCVANNTDVYLITGTTLNTTLTSGANAFAGFSGGACKNCGVTINAVTNKAVIAMGFNPSPSHSALQFLDLATNNFAAPFPSVHAVSEDILWDPTRNLILSPNEGDPNTGGGTYDLFDTSSATPVEYANFMLGNDFQELDSACEDCLTGIALSTREFSNRLFLADLTQATFTPGSPGTWTSGAGQGFQTFPEFSGFAGGTCGIAVAPGSHLAIVSGEFGGDEFGVIQLPSTAGGMPPIVVDYAAATMPNDPDGNPFSMGCDPHTLTAYVSPNTGKAIGLMTDYGATPCYAGDTPVWIAVIDLQGLLNAPRVLGTHTVSSIPAGVVTFVHD